MNNQIDPAIDPAFANSQFKNHLGLKFITPCTELPDGFSITSHKPGGVDYLFYWLHNKYEYAPFSESYPLIQAIEDLFEDLQKTRRTINNLINGQNIALSGLRDIQKLLEDEVGQKAWRLISTQVSKAYAVIDEHVLQRAQALKRTYAQKTAKLIRQHNQDIVFISLVNFYHQERLQILKKTKQSD